MVAIVATTPILMSGVMDRGFEVAKQSLAEPLAVLALGAALLSCGWNRMIPAGAAAKIAASTLAAFLLLAAISTALSQNPEVAVFGGYYRREGLFAWSVYGAFFFAVAGWAQRTDRIESFLDVLLLTSVFPAVYALQQRLDLDFYFAVDPDLTRPGGTLGSPLFLAAYFGLLLPITAARCWQARLNVPELSMWLAVAALQLSGLLVTQTRGPLAAAVLGILMLACGVAARARARRVFVLAVVVFTVIAGFVIAVNTLPGARVWAQDVPVVSRLVFNLGYDAGANTQRASRSAAARIAMWGAGVETFAAAPRANQLLGYGPESAYEHYFSHIPVSIIRLLGNEVFHAYDRMHADTLDIGLNFGLLAWCVYCLFFGAVIFAAARALFGLTGIVSPWRFFYIASGGGVLAAFAAGQAGLASAAVPAFGLGIGAGWFLFMAGCAWRALVRGFPPMSTTQSGRWIVLAGLVSALLAFWVDAQVNIPVLTTRLLSFAIAALILILANSILHGETEPANATPAGEDHLWAWGVGCSVVAACASTLPAGIFDPATAALDAGRWGRRLMPVAAFLAIAAWAAWLNARRCGGLRSRVICCWIAIAIGLPSIYAAIHFALTVRPDSEPTFHLVQEIAMTSIAGPLFIFLMCLVFAAIATRVATRSAGPMLVSPAARWSIWAVAAAVLLVAEVDWRATRAGVALRLAEKASAQQSHLSVQLLEEAIRLMPYERHFRRQLVFDLLGRAVADIRRLKDAPEKTAETPDRIAAVVRNLAAAETAARTAALLFPRDPWVVVALANVLQMEALRVLRPLDPEGGMRAAQEANQLFARTHAMFPSQPVFLRNWAQLLADQGSVQEAYRLLDIMENLIPGDPEPYSERIAIAAQTADNVAISATLARARVALETGVFSQLLDVAKRQQE